MLRVWLPLNGTLENKGISNLTFTNENTTNITVDTNGKIGSCYKKATVATAGRIVSDSAILLDGDLSMCCWAKVTATKQDTAQGLVTNHSVDTKSGFSLNVKQISTTDYRICCSTGNGSSRTYYDYYGTTNIKDAWHHLALTYNNTTHQFQLWVDGKVEKTQSYTNSAVANKIMIFAWAVDNSTTTYYPACMLNDVRIYDHCLSAAEVHELAQGLVCHYKLDFLPYNYSKNKNTSWTNFTLGQYYYTIFSYSMADFVAATGAVNGDKFTWSVDINGTGNVKHLSARVQHYNTGSDRTSVIGNSIGVGESGRAYITFTVNTSYAQLDFMIHNSDSGSVTANSTEQYRLCRIERGDVHTGWMPTDTGITIEDSSGYNHNGTINGTLTLNSNTARYSAAIYFNGTDAAIQIPFNDCIKTDDYTVSVWTYKSVIGEKAYQTILGGPSGFELEARSNTNASPLYRIHNWGGGTTAYDLNKWNLFTFVRTASDSKLYVNGELKLTGTAGNAPPSGNYFIGAWKTATQQNYDGMMSDFRIYCTALDAAAVKQLYELGAKVDNKGNIHGYEFIENNTPKIYKTGIIENKYLRECLTVPVSRTSVTYTPAANTNNSCSGVINADFTEFQDLGTSLTVTLDCDISWSNLQAGTGGTFDVILQGQNRKREDSSWAWAGSNYLTAGFSFVDKITANKTSSLHRKYTATIPASWFQIYNGSRISFRTNYADGVGSLTLSNVKVYLSQETKIEADSTYANQLIEF